MEEFVVGFKVNQRFNRLVAGNFTVEGTGAAVVLGAILTGRPSFIAAGLVVTLAGAVMLFADLGNPVKSWRSIYKPGKSWISRGALFLIGLVFFSALLLISPPIELSLSSSFLLWGTAGSAVLVILYTGFLLSSMKSVPFWNNGFLPALFMLHSMVSGFVLLHFLFASTKNGMATSHFYFRVEILLLVITFAMTALYVSYISKSSSAAAESVRMLVKGKLRNLFIPAALVGGLLVPIVLIIISLQLIEYNFDSARWILCCCFIFRIIGDYCFRLSILRTGVYEPVIL